MRTIEVPLTQGQFATIDEADAALVCARKWFAVRHKYGFYACTNIDRRNVYMHRFLLGHNHGRDRVVDHRNHNGLDNRRENIRLVTHTENNMNRRSRVGSPQYAGVYARGPAWRASIKLNGNIIPLGYFATKEEAGIAYATAVRVGQILLGAPQ